MTSPARSALSTMRPRDWPDLRQSGGSPSQPAQAGLGIGDRRGDRLIDLVGDGGGQLAHGRDAVGVRKLHLHLAEPPLALARLGFHSLALGQVEHEGDTLGPALLEGRPADQHGHAAAVLAEVLLLEGLQLPVA